MKFLLFFLIFGLTIAENSSAQENQFERFGIKDRFKPLTLNLAIAQGLKDNHDQVVRNFTDDSLNLQWEDTWKSFWLPKLTFTLSKDIQRVGHYRTGSSDTVTTPTAPSGTAQLALSEYTVFNWGKDYLSYLNDKQTIKRSQQAVREGRRGLKHSIISKYFEMVAKKEIETLRRDQLRHASFVYRLNRERVSAQKIGKQDYYQARAEYLRARNDFFEAKRELDVSYEEMAFLLDDEPGTKYVIRETLKFIKVKTSLTNAYQLSERNTPAVLAAKVNRDTSLRDYDIAFRENLPLPKFTINLGAYTQSLGRSQYEAEYETLSGRSSIEMVVSLDATWTIYGEGGFFNKRKLEISHIAKNINERKLLQQKDYAKSLIKRVYEKILNYEKQVELLAVRSENARKTFDIVLDNYSKKKSAIVNYLLALRDYNDSEVDHVQAKLNHLQHKVILASYTGIEDFPGERFEELAVKKKGIDDLLKDEEGDQ